MRTARRLFVFACVICLLAGGAAQALPVTFSYTGTVTDDPFGLSSFGAPISGSYTYDSAAVDAIPGPATGSYATTGPGIGFTANVNGANYSVLGALTVNTANNIAGVDQYGAIALDGVCSPWNSSSRMRPAPRSQVMRCRSYRLL